MNSKDAYDNGVKPYRNIMARVVLPRRYPKGDRRNMRRSMVMMAAQHQLKNNFKPCGLQGCPGCSIKLRFSKKPLREIH